MKKLILPLSAAAALAIAACGPAVQPDEVPGDVPGLTEAPTVFDPLATPEAMGTDDAMSTDDPLATPAP